MSATSVVRNIAFGGGILCAALVTAAPFLLRRNIKDSNAYKESLKLLRAHPEAVKYMGEPIEAGTIKILNTKDNSQKGNNFKFTVPVKGPNGEGKLRYFVNVSGEDPNYIYDLSSVELSLDKFPDHKLMIKKPQ